MPIITVKMATGRTVGKKRALVTALTKVAAELLDAKPEWVTVLIEEYDRENWAVAGELMSDRPATGSGEQNADQ